MVVNTKHARTNFNGLLNFVAHTDAGRELFKNPNSVYLFTTNKREREREEDRQCVCVCVVIWSLLLRSFGEIA